ncbi:MAG: DNA-binding transcriptional MerR regulator [Candidatus Aldehydirespiratoraceae bacterium]|jgi:DNA-binding transcriptional MerR regulator
MLKEEHADVTISKIRFFESQGLIDPERTPSGYRKFYDDDVARLRWILVQQRDNFLPLKVIKRRMEESGFDPTAEVVPEASSEPSAAASEVSADTPAEPDDGAMREPTLFARRDEDATEEPAAVQPEPAPESAPADTAPPEPEPKAVQEPPPETEPEAESMAEPEPEPEPDPGPEAVEVPPAPAISDGDPLDVPAGSVSLTPLELAEAAGVDLGLIADLDRLGLIQMVAAGEGQAYDHEALVVTRAAGVFMARGVEPRHLRMFRIAADRQSGILEQLVGAKLRKGGESQRVARAELNELVQLGESIQRSVLRRSFGSQLD